jgi:hypothetical protein
MSFVSINAPRWRGNRRLYRFVFSQSMIVVDKSMNVSLSGSSESTAQMLGRSFLNRR